MGKSIRIKTTPGGGDKYVSLNIEQDFDFLEVLSVKIRQDDVYRRFCSDYGVVVGRVILNDGFGAPNAKVSVFIPLDEEDEDNTLITSIYPYKSVTDTDSEFVRYNLLPEDKQNEFHQPVGTFPSKRKILNNDVYLDVYDKYYKFTTTTNGAGDFMLFGVPVGQQTIHFDLDLSDMGNVSLTPADLISSGVNENELIPINFTNTSITTYEFKQSTDLALLPQIKTTDIDVDVQPFWGDAEQCQIGISRLDWKVPGEIKPSALFFGNIFAENHQYFYYDSPRKRANGSPSISTVKKDLSGVIDVYTVLPGDTNSRYYRTYVFENGKYDLTIPMNNGYVMTDEFGNTVPSDNINVGLASYGDFRFIFTPNDEVYSQGGYTVRRGKHAIPSYHTVNSQTPSIPKDENAPLTKFSSVSTDPNDNQVSGQYLDLFYTRPYVYYYRFKAGHIHTTNQQQGGGSSGPNDGIFQLTNLANQNSFPFPFFQNPGSFPFFFKGSGYANAGKVIGTLYFPSFGYSSKCIFIPDDVAKGLTYNPNSGTWCNNQNGSIGTPSALAPYYYIQNEYGNSIEIGLVDIKDLNSDYNYFKETGSKSLPNGLPETSAGLNTGLINQDQFNIDGQDWYVYFGTSPNNTILNEVKEKYNV